MRYTRFLTCLFTMFVLAACGTPDAPGADLGSSDLMVMGSDAAAPLDGSTLRGVVTVRLHDEAVSHVDYSVDNLRLSLASSSTFTVSGSVDGVELDTTLLDDGRYVLTAAAQREDGSRYVASATFSVANLTCDAIDRLVIGAVSTTGEWVSVDIGDVSMPGATERCDAERPLVVSAAGGDVWDDQDSFRFTHKSLEGDGSLTVRVDALEAVHEWTKVGVMIRENASSNSRNAFMLLTDARGVVFQGRAETGGTTTDMQADGIVMADAAPRAPWWLRIERRGDVLIGSHSADGVAWVELGRLTVDMPEKVLIGTAVTSTSNRDRASATFSNFALVRGGTSDVIEPAPSPQPAPTAPSGETVRATYSELAGAIRNPEIGWHGYGRASNYAYEASRGLSLVRHTVRLDDYRYTSLPQSLLDGLDRDLAGLRDHGLKIVLRFSYNFGREPDAPLERVLQHIDQLTPVLRKNTDVIAALQAGFIGAWGEWHATTNDLLTLDARTRITNRLLDAMDGSRMVQIRYPYRARDMFPTPPNGDTAFDGSDASRVAQLNDCFVSSSSDGGTFIDSTDYAYAEAVTPYTVMGGETCAIAGLNSRNDGHVALAELERFHYDYLNLDFYTPILDKWRQQGYFDEITERLGYRFVMREATADGDVVPGGTYSLRVRVDNEGFGKLYNPRPLNVVLRPVSGGTPVILRAVDDARHVLPLGGETRDVDLTVRVPSDLPAGAYEAALSLPDAADTLADDSRYAVRLANVGVWDAATGSNALGLRVQVGDVLAGR